MGKVPELCPMIGYYLGGLTDWSGNMCDKLSFLKKPFTLILLSYVLLAPGRDFNDRALTIDNI